MKVLKIWFYKYMATMHYNLMQEGIDRYDCGYNLACYIDPRIKHHEDKMDFWIQKIKDIEGGSR